MTYQTITVKTHQKQDYPIYIGQQLYANEKILRSSIHGTQVLIVTQENIAEHYLPLLQKTLSNLQCDVVFLPEGETAKNIKQWQKIIDLLLEKQHERSTTLIALGGGVIGDVTGFAAACYQRGVNYIQIPTSLMAQVDSAIGGKTAVNHPLGKNMIGAFYQPQCVITDINLLQTLSSREFNSGIAEVIKYGLILDKEFFIWLENNIQLLLVKNTDALLYAVARSAAIKAEIVSQDEKDLGLRNLLNFGHTFAHAIETASDYQVMLHGEAVAWGMVMAAELSVLLGYLSVTDKQRIVHLLQQSHLLQATKSLPVATEMLKLMQRDKKVTNGKLNLILLNELGVALKTIVADEKKVTEAIENTRTLSFEKGFV